MCDHCGCRDLTPIAAPMSDWDAMDEWAPAADVGQRAPTDVN
jgi:hypothetical protein